MAEQQSRSRQSSRAEEHFTSVLNPRGPIAPNMRAIRLLFAPITCNWQSNPDVLARIEDKRKEYAYLNERHAEQQSKA